MRTILTTASTTLLLTLALGWQVGARTPPQAVEPAATCGTDGRPHVRTTLYFGLSRPTGAVSSAEWDAFLRDTVTPRFPDGLTVVEASGQWRTPTGQVAREQSKVLLLVHDDTAAARETLAAVVADYKMRFSQKAVLWESAAVCATF